MMGAAVDPVDHGIGFAVQLVVQAAVDQPADDRRRRGAAIDGIVADAAVLAALGEGAVHGLDDVAAHAEIAQAFARPPSPIIHWPGPIGCGEAERSSFCSAADHQRGAIPDRLRPDSPGAGRRRRSRRRRRGWRASSRVQRSASTSRSSAERISCSAARTELEGDELLGARAQAAADVVAGDDEILAVVVAAAHQEMDMRIVGVPMIDGDPVELGAEIALRHPPSGRG